MSSATVLYRVSSALHHNADPVRSLLISSEFLLLLSDSTLLPAAPVFQKKPARSLHLRQSAHNDPACRSGRLSCQRNVHASELWSAFHPEKSHIPDPGRSPYAHSSITASDTSDSASGRRTCLHKPLHLDGWHCPSPCRSESFPADVHQISSHRHRTLMCLCAEQTRESKRIAGTI